MTTSPPTRTPRPWLRILAWSCGAGAFPALLMLWWYQPYFGANACLLKGFMWNTDFVEEVRPTMRKIIERGLAHRQEHGTLPPGVTPASIFATLDLAINEFKNCLAERGVEYCRYVGPNKNGTVRFAYTVDGPNAIETENMYRYRYLKPDLKYEFHIIPQDAGGSEFKLTILKDENFVTGGLICYLGC